MTNKEQQNNNEKQTNFFQFTKEQFFVNLEKYDCVKKGYPSTLFATPSISADTPKEIASVYPKRLNSIDTSMLEDVAYTVLDDEDLKLEKKIENTEKILKELTEKLIVADAIDDKETVSKLLHRQEIVKKEQEDLLVSYKTKVSGRSLASNFSRLCQYSQEIKGKISKKIKKFLRTSVLLKKIKPLMRSLMVRETIGKLKKINKSVDELVNMQIPFGEQEERYATLITHLSRAGALHSKISKELKS